MPKGEEVSPLHCSWYYNQFGFLSEWGLKLLKTVLLWFHVWLGGSGFPRWWLGASVQTGRIRPQLEGLKSIIMSVNSEQIMCPTVKHTLTVTSKTRTQPQFRTEYESLHREQSLVFFFLLSVFLKQESFMFWILFYWISDKGFPVEGDFEGVVSGVEEVSDCQVTECVRPESSLRLWGLFLLAVSFSIDQCEGCSCTHLTANSTESVSWFFSFFVVEFKAHFIISIESNVLNLSEKIQIWHFSSLLD